MILRYTEPKHWRTALRIPSPIWCLYGLLTIDLGHVLAGQVVGVVRGARIDGRIAHGEELVHPGNWSTQNKTKRR